MSIFKETFPAGVIGQLTARQDALLRRDFKSIQYLNSRTAWIRMTSAVEVKGDGGRMANDNVLLGGALTAGALREGIFLAYTTTTPGGTSHRLGNRPMPGITGIEVKTKGEYGSLREVTVSFNCWDIKQLEDLELLYMRQNYTVLVEWGWMPYLDNNGNLKNNPRFINDVLEGKGPKEDIWTKIHKQASEDGNYDAIYGHVKNYNWSARPDGGYDCTTTIITMGEVLESLKVNYGSFDTNVAEKGMFGLITGDEYFGKDASVNKSYSNNIVAGMLDEIWQSSIKNTSKSPTGAAFNLKLGKFNCDLFRFDITIDGRADDGAIAETFVVEDAQIYIALENFVDLLNEYILLYDPTAKKPILKVSVREGEHTDPNQGLLTCVANKFQLSTDPSVCLIKNEGYADPSKLGFKDGFSTDYTTIKGLMTSLKRDYFKGTLGIIGNIYVNLGYLYSLIIDDNLGSQDPKEKKEISLYDYLKNIMSGINSATGNVANFEIFIDPVDSVARIVDISYTEADRAKAFDNAFVVQTHNTKSTVRSYQFASQMFPEQSTTVSIGAQEGGSGALGTNPGGLETFNKGIVDRVIPFKVTPPSPNNSNTKIEDKIKNLKTSIDVIIYYLNEIDASWYESVGDFDVGQSTKYANALRDIINFWKSYSADDNKNRDIIPTTLSLEMDGIGGIVIGNLFKIPEDLIPRGYRGIDVGSKAAYTVTGISHTVQNNDWVTKIDGKLIVMDKPTGTITEDQWGASSYDKIETAEKPKPPVLNANDPGFISTGQGNELGIAGSLGGGRALDKNRIQGFGKIDLKIVPAHAAAILDMCAYTEGTSNGGGRPGFNPANNGYDIMVTYKKLDGWTPDTTIRHPNIVLSWSPGQKGSTATGRYQFLHDTWVAANSRQNAAMSKNNQDKAGYWLLTTGRPGIGENAMQEVLNIAKSGVIDVNQNPTFLKILGAPGKEPNGFGLSWEWASVPGYNGKYAYASTGQVGKEGPQDMYNIYLTALKAYGVKVPNVEITERQAATTTTTIPTTTTEITSESPTKLGSQFRCKDKIYIINSTNAPGVTIPPRASWTAIKKVFPMINGNVPVIPIGTPCDIINTGFAYKMKWRACGQRVQPAEHIVLHYTVSNSNDPTIHYKTTWEGNSNRPSSEFCIGRTGRIAGFRNYKTIYANHYGNPTFPGGVNGRSIGFEIEAIGFCYYCKSNGKFYTNGPPDYDYGHNEIQASDLTLTNPYRTFNVWHAHSDVQISAIANLIIALYNDGAISDKTKFISNCTGTNRYGTLFPNTPLRSRPAPGIITHGTGRTDKCDTQPQSNLLEMLDDLPNLIASTPKNTIKWTL